MVRGNAGRRSSRGRPATGTAQIGESGQLPFPTGNSNTKRERAGLIFVQCTSFLCIALVPSRLLDTMTGAAEIWLRFAAPLAFALDHSPAVAPFPSSVTANLRVRSVIRADPCLCCGAARARCAGYTGPLTLTPRWSAAQRSHRSRRPAKPARVSFEFATNPKKNRS